MYYSLPQFGKARKHFSKAATVTAASLTESELDYNGKRPVGALISTTTQAVTITLDGTTPTATVGHNIATTFTARFYPGNIQDLQWIRSGGTDGVIQITLYYD